MTTLAICPVHQTITYRNREKISSSRWSLTWTYTYILRIYIYVYGVYDIICTDSGLSSHPIRDRSHLADHAITITARSAISKIADHIIRLQRITDHSFDHRRRSHRSLRSANPSFFHFLHFTCAISPITKTLYAFLQRVRNQCLPNHVIYSNLRKQRFAIRPITEVKWIFRKRVESRTLHTPYKTFIFWVQAMLRSVRSQVSAKDLAVSELRWAEPSCAHRIGCNQCDQCEHEHDHDHRLPV